MRRTQSKLYIVIMYYMVISAIGGKGSGGGASLVGGEAGT